MVSTDGLTPARTGSVSQAGKVSTRVGAEVGAQVVGQPVGVAGGGHGHHDRAAGARVARPAMVRARAGSGTARTAEDRPSTDAKPGSSRSSGGRSRSNMGTAEQATGGLRGA